MYTLGRVSKLHRIHILAERNEIFTVPYNSIFVLMPARKSIEIWIACAFLFFLTTLARQLYLGIDGGG